MYTGKNPCKSIFHVEGPININMLEVKIQDGGFDRYKSSTCKLVNGTCIFKFPLIVAIIAKRMDGFLK